MDIKDLDKKQLILLTLLITFVVSIATGIITVSLMKQMPESVPQTINNVIQRTIEKVTTVEVPVSAPSNTGSEVKENNNSIFTLGSNDSLIPIYKKDQVFPEAAEDLTKNEEVKAIGQGVIISDIGLVLVESSIMTDGDLYKVLLDKKVFDASLLKKFDNGFAILKISTETKNPIEEIKEVSTPQ